MFWMGKRGPEKPGRPATHEDGTDQCAELLAGRFQALVDQLQGIVALWNLGMTADAYGNLDKHIAKCAAAGQKAIDAHAEFHGEVCERVYTECAVEFMSLVR